MTAYHAIITPKPDVSKLSRDDVSIIRMDMVFDIGDKAENQDAEEIVAWCLRQLHISHYVQVEVHAFDESVEQQEGQSV